MPLGEVTIAPNLSILILWNARTAQVLQRQFHAVMVNPSAEQEEFLSEYGWWHEARDAAYEHIKRLYAVTGSLPVVGDHLDAAGDRLARLGETFRIEKRTLCSHIESDGVLLVYEVSSAEIEVSEGQ